MCVSSDGQSRELCLMDSANMIVERKLLLQIACMFNNEKESSLQLARLPVQQQNGSQDCGLFAIALAVEVCRGSNPGAVVFCQEKMRDHLVTCLESMIFTSFPIAKRKRLTTKAKASTEVYELYCVCHYPASYDTKMIECCGCEKWFHYACVGLKDTENVDADWFCGQCSSVGFTVAIGKPKEFLPRK